MKADDADVVRVWGRLLELLAKYNEKNGDYNFRVWSDGSINLELNRHYQSSRAFDDIEGLYDYLIRNTEYSDELDVYIN